MTRMRIIKKDGTPTPFFWVKKPGGKRTRQTVYKDTASGVKRMKGIHFNLETKRFARD